MNFKWRRQWHPTPVLLPGKSHGRRSLEGYSPWGHWGLDMTERLHFHFPLSRIGEGNGNPLQCSCLENPRDGGAWWAAVCGVAQSRTRLKWLSSSSSKKENTRPRWIKLVNSCIHLRKKLHEFSIISYKGQELREYFLTQFGSFLRKLNLLFLDDLVIRLLGIHPSELKT